MSPLRGTRHDGSVLLDVYSVSETTNPPKRSVIQRRHSYGVCQVLHATSNSLADIIKINVMHRLEMTTWSTGKRGLLWIPRRLGGLVVSDRRHLPSRER
ncbi:hypothetical protein Y032_0260g523 [Ancylostoma ceylanicum]|uniref:Uncharacterized protein n=1 Tax=Ancylostoma ceylanicum TaxID=53326 RepID=A0A016SBD7_9BILA|nr:hypothetical protein Y032_0260g523 [Ancylostoma ceylanicum]